ncbi:hypothetical protein GCM10023310_70220 [Paenibacillus vulneris]|uniref:Uncharacterized protein n=1 Tax=Paenibacillus vulneris TaxID=1133364 RepID=A0ABW3UIE3_9BACL
MRQNSWGLQFVKVNVKENEFETLLGLNLESEEKAKEIFNRIKTEFVENKNEPECVVDLLDEDDSIIDDYALTMNQVVTVASLLGYVVNPLTNQFQQA